MIERLEDQWITEEAERRGTSKSTVHKDLRRLGYSVYRREFGLDDLKPKVIDEEKKVDTSKDLFAEMRKREAENPKGKRLADAWFRDKLFDFRKKKTHLGREDDWQEIEK